MHSTAFWAWCLRWEPEGRFQLEEDASKSVRLSSKSEPREWLGSCCCLNSQMRQQSHSWSSHSGEPLPCGARRLFSTSLAQPLHSLCLQAGVLLCCDVHGTQVVSPAWFWAVLSVRLKPAYPESLKGGSCPTQLGPVSSWCNKSCRWWRGGSRVQGGPCGPSPWSSGNAHEGGPPYPGGRQAAWGVSNPQRFRCKADKASGAWPSGLDHTCHPPPCGWQRDMERTGLQQPTPKAGHH